MANRFKTKKNNFTQISNQVLLDDELSLKAKGLYSIIQHFITIPDFVLYLNTLKKQVKEGEHSFNATWKELKDKGYLLQERKKDTKTGKFYYEYELLDEKNHTPKNHSMENPVDGKLPVYNNTNLINTNLNNTNNNYKVQETCTRLCFSEIIKTAIITGDKEMLKTKKYIIKEYFASYEHYTKYDKHFSIDKKQWQNIDTALEYLIDFFKENGNTKKVFLDLIEENFALDTAYFSLQGFLNVKRLKYLLHKLEYLYAESIFDCTGKFDENLD